MDYRVFPGVPRTNRRILSVTKKYLGIKKVDIGTRKADVAAWVNLVMILLQDYNRTMTQDEIGAIVNKDRSLVPRANKLFREKYHGDSLFFHYIYMNCKAEIESRDNFSIRLLFIEASKYFPVTHGDIHRGGRMIRGEINSRLRNPVIKALVSYLQKESISSVEIRKFLNLPKGTTLFYQDIENKSEYIKCIEDVIKSKLKILKINKETCEKED